MKPLDTKQGPGGGGAVATARRSLSRSERVPFPRQQVEKLPTVSVVIPCYNYGQYLPAAVESVTSQRGVDVEIIIVDDVSTDNSLSVARDLAHEEERIQVVERVENGGPVAAFNEGLACVEGEYLVRLDADDLLTPGSLSRAVAVGEYFPRVGLVYGHPLHFEGDELPRARSKPSSVTIWRDRKWLEDRCARGHNVITSPEVLMRTSVVRHVGGQSDLAHTHDMEHWLRISAFSDVAYLHGVDQAWHREHAQSLSSREVTGPLDLEQRLLAFQTLFDAWGVEIDATNSMRRSAEEAIARIAIEAAEHALDAGLSWDGTFVPYRALVARTGVELPEALACARPADTRTVQNVLSGQWRRLKLGIKYRISRRRWHRRGVY